jgi:hypothetical protein
MATVPLRVVPDWLSVTRSQRSAVPLPGSTYEVPGQLTCILSLSAYTPAKLVQLYPQMPALQTGIAFAIVFGHTLPHPPQFVTEVSAVSQPFLGLLSQLPQPLVQVGAHAPPTQLVLPCVLLQTTPQLPQ